MTGTEAWKIIAPMIAPIYTIPNVGTPNSEIGMNAYLTVYRACKELDEHHKEDKKK